MAKSWHTYAFLRASGNQYLMGVTTNTTKKFNQLRAEGKVKEVSYVSGKLAKITAKNLLAEMQNISDDPEKIKEYIERISGAKRDKKAYFRAWLDKLPVFRKIHQRQEMIKEDKRTRRLMERREEEARFIKQKPSPSFAPLQPADGDQAITAQDVQEEN